MEWLKQENYMLPCCFPHSPLPHLVYCCCCLSWMLVSIGVCSVVLTVLLGDNDGIDLPCFQPKRGKWEDLMLFIAAIMLSCWDLPAVPSSSIIFLARRCVLSCSLIFLFIISVCKRLTKRLEFFTKSSKCFVGTGLY